MEFMDLGYGVRALTGAVNMGLVSTSEGLVAVDTGLDKQSAKKLLRAAEAVGEPLVAIINTHAHADHFGGNATLLSRNEAIRVYAPVDEAAVIRQPYFEPQYLWQGANPFGSLQNKFLLAPASRVDIEFAPGEVWSIGSTEFKAIGLPGHAHAQCGIVVNDVLFAADSYFGIGVTDKHGIPFLVDYEKTLESAKAAGAVSAKWWVPGHGDPTQDPALDIEHLCRRHEQVYMATVRSVIDEAGDAALVSLDELTGRLCREFHLEPANAGSWLLVRTTVAAYVSAAVDTGQVDPVIDEGVLRLAPREV